MVVDANVLLYSVNPDARHHAASVDWLETALSGTGPVLFPWVSLLAFLRVATSRSVFSDPYGVEEAFGFVESWLAAPPSQVVEPGSRHFERVRDMLSGIGAGGNLTTDAHVAAIAVERGVPIVSFDNDFDRFEGVERFQPGTG